jgi:dolichyl-phosphate-mannose--protein O-mannosyl transferase
MTWGSGSHMQIMTSVKETDNNDSLFIIKEGHMDSPCETGTPVKCNSIIRFEHASTGKNIHSHSFPSFITDSQEVCGFGQNGFGDVNDNFQLICYNSNEPLLKGKTQFFLLHVGTKQFLYVNIKKSLFNEYNCRGCPIMNHREVSCTTNKDKQALWKVIGGIIYGSGEEKDHVDVKSDDL